MKTKVKPVKRAVPTSTLLKRNPKLTKELLTQLEINSINAYMHLFDLKKASACLDISPACCLALMGSALVKLEYIHSLK